MNNMIKFNPTVFAVENDYKIFIPVTGSSVMWVKVGGECYYDHSNGVLRSSVTMHKVTVPRDELDKYGKYTVCFREMIERKPYFSVTSDIYEEEFDFYPLPNDNFRAYHISDAHGAVAAPVNSALSFEKKYGKIDLLILNGDVIDHSGDIGNFDAIYEICSLISKGSIPVIFSRGNHDTRGEFAENIADYTPTRAGYSYFSFRLGTLWGLVLDCGEDKLDTHAEYGNTNCCHAFRTEETKYIKNLTARKSEEYGNDGITRKIVIAHSPFSMKFEFPFDIEDDIYTEWCAALREEIKPNVMISGHTHSIEILPAGDEKHIHGCPCPVVIGGRPDKKSGKHYGCGLIFDGNGLTAVFNQGEEIIGEHKVY